MIFLHLVMYLQSHRSALPILYFWISDPAVFSLKTVLILWEFEGSVFMKVAVDILKIILELEYPGKEFSLFSYDFPKLLVRLQEFLEKNTAVAVLVGFRFMLLNWFQ